MSFPPLPYVIPAPSLYHSRPFPMSFPPLPHVIPALPYVIPALPYVIPALPYVIPAPSLCHSREGGNPLLIRNS